jgi:hypothetical protein
MSDTGDKAKLVPVCHQTLQVRTNPAYIFEHYWCKRMIKTGQSHP